MSPMKIIMSDSRRLPFVCSAMTAAILLLFTVPSVRAAETTTTEDQAGQARQHTSTFALPRTLNEGRDPFYPTSTRVIAMTRPTPTKAPGPATLELKGISGTPERPLAIINNQTLAVGEEQPVSTPQGRVKVMCLAIEGTKVMIRAQGKTRQLTLRKGI